MFSQKEVAARVGVSPSTISRELRRNCCEQEYDPQNAHHKAIKRKQQASGCARKMTPIVIKYIEQKLREKWSPEQISGYMQRIAYHTPVSHETIYKYVWADKKRGGALHRHLRHQGKSYNYNRGSRNGRGCIPNRVDIKERPARVDSKQDVGDWEVDTLIGKRHKGVLLTLVDRRSKRVLIETIHNKKALNATFGIVQCLHRLPVTVVRTLTFDNGKEFAKHRVIAEFFDAKCYFATPYHSWERGLNEHTNGLIRQYFPKSKDLSNLTAKELRFVEDQLNDRPRKELGFKTPREVYDEESHCVVGHNASINTT